MAFPYCIPRETIPEEDKIKICLYLLCDSNKEKDSKTVIFSHMTILTLPWCGPAAAAQDGTQWRYLSNQRILVI